MSAAVTELKERVPMGLYLNERQTESTKDMERTSRKRKGLFINGPPNKRFRKTYVGFRGGKHLRAKRRDFKPKKFPRLRSHPASFHIILWAFCRQQIQSHAYKRALKEIERKKTDTQWEKPSSPPAVRIFTLGARGSYMKESLGLYQYINTCVPDTLLASFHILSIKHGHVEALLRSDDLFRVLLETLNEEKYNYARALWIRELDDFLKRDRFSNIKDHFPIIDKLVCAKVDYHQETPEDHPIYTKTLEKFRPFGDLRALGDVSDPSLILVHRDVHNPRYDPCMPRIPPLAVTADNGRKFELEVLLLGHKQHLVMCFKLSDNIWISYDNARGILYQPWDINSLYTNDDIRVCSAIYVNSSLAEEIPKTGLWVEEECFSKRKILSDPMNLETLLQNMCISNSFKIM